MAVCFLEKRPAGRGGGVALCVREQREGRELSLGVGAGRVQRLRVKMKGPANTRDAVVGVCYGPPDEGGEANEAFYRQWQAASRCQALVLTGDFSLPDTCWKANPARLTQSRRFLQSTDGNFLTQVVEEPTRQAVLSDPFFASRGLVGDVKVEGSLGRNDHEMAEFRVLC